LITNSRAVCHIMANKRTVSVDHCPLSERAKPTTRSGGPPIAMMQTTKTRKRDDAGSRESAPLSQPVARRFFRHAEMGPVLVIIEDVIIHQAF
jgi:hypothetical protein